MNWKLVAKLSLFGLAMAIGTVFLIPSSVEPLFWLALFVIRAVAIARVAPGSFFLHGLYVSLLDCVWVTGAHMAFSDLYLARHPAEAAALETMPMPDSPRLMMLMVGPILGVVSGIVLGLLSMLASKVIPRAV